MLWAVGWKRLMYDKRFITDRATRLRRRTMCRALLRTSQLERGIWDALEACFAWGHAWKKGEVRFKAYTVAAVTLQAVRWFFFSRINWCSTYDGIGGDGRKWHDWRGRGLKGLADQSVLVGCFVANEASCCLNQSIQGSDKLSTLRDWRLFLPSTRASLVSSTYALSCSPYMTLLGPICCNGVLESWEIFLCQPCLGLNLEDPPLAQLFISGNLNDLPGGIACCNRRSAAARSTTTSAGHGRRRGVH